MIAAFPLPRYDPSQTYRWNYDHAPTELPQIALPAFSGNWTYCGRAVPSPLAIAAGPLLNGRWILYYAAIGFDVLTYKTTRSAPRACYPLPNLQPVASPSLSAAGGHLLAATSMAESWAISFGMPSMSPDEWRADVEWTRARLPKEKLLSVSVVGSPAVDGSPASLADDFARCARWAWESGADCVECNFSCPNVATLDGQLYQQPADASLVAQRVRQAIGSCPLVIKIGFLDDESLCGELLDAVAPFSDALAMTNCIAATIDSAPGQPLFEGQPRGIGGAAIRSASIAQVRRFGELRRRRGYATKIIGGGGITSAADVRMYLESGAESVQLATAAMVDPLIGMRIRSEWEVLNRRDTPAILDDELRQSPSGN